MVPAPVERSQLPGHRQRSQIPQHRQWWRSPRSLSAAEQRLGKISGIWQRLPGPLPSRARARRRRFQRARRPTDLHRPARRRCGCWPTSTVLFSGIGVGRFRRWTLALGRPAPLLMAASPGRGGFAGSGRLRRVGAAAMVPAPVERSQLPGHRQRSQIPQHRQWWRSRSLAQRCGAAARKDQRNLAAFTRSAALTRAREAAPISARSEADRPAPAGSAALRLLADVDSSF